jgi:phage shock protein C
MAMAPGRRTGRNARFGLEQAEIMETNKNCSSCFTEIDARAIVCPHCQHRQTDAAPLHRGVPGRIIGGVCAGLAQYLGVDVSLVRVMVAFATLVSGGLVCTAYLMMWAITPPSPKGVAPLARFIGAIRDLFSPKGQNPATDGRPAA